MVKQKEELDLIEEKVSFKKDITRLEEVRWQVSEFIHEAGISTV